MDHESIRNTQDKITVLIADDHPIVRAGLRMTADAADDICVVHEAGDGEGALRAIEEFRPAVAVLDIEMPGMSGLDVLRETGARGLPTKCIILTLHDNRAMFERAVRLGAVGYLLKDSAITDIVTGIRRVAEGDCYISPALGAALPRPRRERDAAAEAIGLLTPAERRVIRVLAQDMSTREIADALFLSPRTVDRHRANICSKLGLHGAFALLRFALEHQSLLVQDRRESDSDA